MIQIIVLELMPTVSISPFLSLKLYSHLTLTHFQSGTIVRTLRHTATRMKQELANDRGLELAEVDDIPLWVAVSCVSTISTPLSIELTDTRKHRR